MLQISISIIIEDSSINVLLFCDIIICGISQQVQLFFKFTNANNVFNIFRELCDKQHLSLLIVTHDEDFAKRTDRIIMMEDGKIIS